METFKVNPGKMDICLEEIEDCGRMLSQLQGEVSAVRGDLRHKLSSMERIEGALKNIEDKLGTETAMMRRLGSALGTIADNYRYTERELTDFGSITANQLMDMQNKALMFEDVLGDGSGEGFVREVLNCYGYKGPTGDAKTMAKWFQQSDEFQIAEEGMEAMENGVNPGQMWGFGLEKASEALISGCLKWWEDCILSAGIEFLKNLVRKKPETPVFDLKK